MTLLFRDSLGRFAPRPPEYPQKVDIHGVYRYKDGRFAPRPDGLKSKSNVLTLTVADVLDAIEKNGYRHTKGWGEFIGGKMVAGCAIAQGAENLGVEGAILAKVLNRTASGLGSAIIRLNDVNGFTIPQIVKHIRSTYKHQLESVVKVAKK